MRDRPLFYSYAQRLAAVLAVVLIAGLWAVLQSRRGPGITGNQRETAGAEIFRREWLPGDPRSHGGDGLGPVFNDSSCVACHNQAGPGGAGAVEKNVTIISATLRGPQLRDAARQIQTVVDRGRSPGEAKRRFKQVREELVNEVSLIHPGFRSARSIVVHQFGTDSGYETWRLRTAGRVVLRLPGQDAIGEFVEPVGVARTRHAVEEPGAAFHGRPITHNVLLVPVFSGARLEGNFVISSSQRNPTALFGAGVIDAIPARVLEQAARRKFKEFPEVSGRVARLPDGRIGRFGWKGQKASLYDFTMAACAVEVGLNVPDHPQSDVPTMPNYQAAGLDLNQQECDALVEYLRRLPSPAARKTSSAPEARHLREGAELFASVGCGACHSERLGDVAGIYSDLLLHDMGPALGDTGSYGMLVPEASGGSSGPVPTLAEVIESLHSASDGKKPENGEAARSEWRTPPLWGVRDSAPYLHDGRARNLDQAIAFHAGEAAQSSQRYAKLPFEQRLKLQAFLKSLVAPTAVD